jgi:hypothetical protein
VDGPRDVNIVNRFLTGILRKNIRVVAGFIFNEMSEIGPTLSSLRLQLFKTSDTVKTDREISEKNSVLPGLSFWIYHD